MTTAPTHRADDPTASQDVAGVGIRLDGICHQYQQQPVVDVAALDIEPGSFVALLGPSGSGKSTILRLVSGLETPDAGSVRFDRPAERVRLAKVFQDATLLPWRTLLDNVTLPLELESVDRRERRAAATEALEQVGLADAARRYPRELSGGMRMRGSLARALVTRPNLLLLDEPFAAVDEITRVTLDDLLRSLWKRERMTVLFVTHSVSEALVLAERTIVVSHRPARVVLDEPVDLPIERDASVRGLPEFARQCARLIDALEQREPT